MAVTGLSKTQLIDLIQKMASLHPELRAEMEEMLPEPDLKPIDEHLTYLKKNIFKCLPNNRLTSKTDSAAFNKASVHLNALKVSFNQFLVIQSFNHRNYFYRKLL